MKINLLLIAEIWQNSYKVSSRQSIHHAVQTIQYILNAVSASQGQSLPQ